MNLPLKDRVKTLLGLATEAAIHTPLFARSCYFPVPEKVSTLGMKAVFTKWCVLILPYNTHALIFAIGRTRTPPLQPPIAPII